MEKNGVSKSEINGGSTECENKGKTPLVQKLRDFGGRLRKIKNIEIIFSIILIAIILLIYAAYSASKDDSQVSVEQSVTYKETEQKLSELLSSIKGAGKVNVLITYEGTVTQVIAEQVTRTETTRTDSTNGDKLITTVVEEVTQPVYITENGQRVPVVLKELNPKIVGVVIVAEGASDIAVRLELLKAASTALDIKQNIIEIFTMNK